MSRVFASPRELIWRAFTDPDQIASWWSPEGCDIPRETVDVDVRVGGRIYFSMVDSSDGSVIPVRFDIAEISEPELLVFSSDALPEFGLAHRMLTRVQLDILEHGTRVTVTQGPHTDELRGPAQAGWLGCMEKLQRLVESGEGGIRTRDGA